MISFSFPNLRKGILHKPLLTILYQAVSPSQVHLSLNKEVMARR